MITPSIVSIEGVKTPENAPNFLGSTAIILYNFLMSKNRQIVDVTEILSKFALIQKKKFL